MEQDRHEENTKNSLDLKLRDIPYDLNKSSTSSVATVQTAESFEKQDSVSNFASATPEKTIQPSRSKNRGAAVPPRAVKQLSQSYQNENRAIDDEASELLDDLSGDEEYELSHGMTEDEKVQVPDKYRTLAAVFDRLDTAVKLLKLRKKSPTFQNICTVVEVITKRKLSHKHLAQIKYVLQEAIQIEKILIHDEKTLCMVPDMKVTLLLDVIEARLNQSPFMALRQVFRLRLLDFSNKHPEGFDIPEAMLPEPFTERNHAVPSGSLPMGSSVDSHTTHIVSEPPLVSSSVSKFIMRHFSQKGNVPETEKTELLASLNDALPVNSGNETDEDIKFPQQEECSSAVFKSTNIGCSASLIFSAQCPISACQSSPMKALSAAHPWMVETPAQSTPKRTLPSSDDKINTETRALNHGATKKSLDFSLLKSEGSASSSNTDESQLYVDNRVQTVLAKSVLADYGLIASPSALTQKVEQNADDKMTQTGLVKRQQMLATLTGLFNLIHKIFQSANYSVITKQELLQKIIANSLHIVDKREAEEQLELLEELVPDWICQKLVPGGDLFYSIRNVSDLDSIHAKLAEVM